MKSLYKFLFESTQNVNTVTVEELLCWFFDVTDIKKIDELAFKYMWPESLDNKTTKQFKDAFEALKFLKDNAKETVEVTISGSKYEHDHTFNLNGKYFNIIAPEKYPDEINWDYCERCGVAVLPGETNRGYCDICYDDMHG